MELHKHIEPDCNIVVLTGAGISAESGLKTFRGVDGLWEGHRVEDVATPEAFLRNPALVYQFYNERRRGLLQDDVRPNAAHGSLGQLQEDWPRKNGGSVTIVTQNIDNLHERGGAQDVIHMHGELLKMFCMHCMAAAGQEPEYVEKHDILDDLNEKTVCASCHMGGGLRPDIVWFGEMPYHMNRIMRALRDCDLFLSIGTSGNVYPAAGFVQKALYSGAYTMEVNLDASMGANQFHEGIYGPASKKVPEISKILMSL